ncbi:MAG: PQQ-binding-like beta-propeller repeat protein, partial [Caldiserica bacterium]|nr:PQQ-binding-like beta-propeller repeat protein [Caldisericota bacterium]
MKKTLIFLAIFALLAGYQPMFAADPSNNMLLPKDCSLTTEKLTPLWKINLIGNIAFMPQQASGGMLLVATDKSMAVVNSDNGQLAWETKIQDGCKWNVVLSSNASVCVVKTDEIMCLSLVNGSTIWTKRFGENITAQPVSNGENLYVVTGKEISAIGSAKGNLLWKREFKGFVNVTPCLANGNLFLSSLDGYCAALDARDGAIEWESKPGEQPTDALVAYGKNIYMVCDKSLFALDNATGKPIWKFVAKSKGFSPTVTDDALLYPTADKTLYCLDPKTCGKGCCLSTPKQLWQLNKSSMLPRRMAASAKKAYLVTEDGWLNVIDIQKGEVVSRHEIGMDLAKAVFLDAQVVVPGGKILTSFAS